MKVFNGQENFPIGRSIDSPNGLQKYGREYISPKYLSPSRFTSYSYQYSLAIETKCNTFLNIGSGNRILSNLLKQNKKDVIDIDIDWQIGPTITAQLPLLPIKDKSFDVVLCFQVLEHLPFQYFQQSLLEMKRVSKKYIVLSLPDMSLPIKGRIKRIIYQFFSFPGEWYQYGKRPINIEHFWEIGYQKFSTCLITDTIFNAGFEIIKDFRNEFNVYHHFFLLENSDQEELNVK